MHVVLERRREVGGPASRRLHGPRESDEVQVADRFHQVRAAAAVRGARSTLPLSRGECSVQSLTTVVDLMSCSSQDAIVVPVRNAYQYYVNMESEEKRLKEKENGKIKELTSAPVTSTARSHNMNRVE